jgi:hypothetical protein
MVRLRSITHPLRRFGQVADSRRALVLEAVLWLLMARLALAAVPFPRLARRLGTFVPPNDPRVRDAKGAPQAHKHLAREIGWAVTRSARYVPFKAVCLPQAMAARLMLERRGISSTLHFGAAKGKEQPLDAHAWLDCAGVEVTGYPVGESFSEIACFV